MILQPPTKDEFDFQEKIQIDVENKGFSQSEIEQLAGPQEIEDAGAMGIGDLLNKVWRPNRIIPPEIENLKSEFGYQANPIMTDLIAVAEAQNTELAGVVKAKVKNYNFYIMRCGVFISPGEGEKFEALKFEVRYDNDKVSTFTMMPGPQANKILELGGTADVGVTGEVDFGFPEIPLKTASVDATAKAKLEAKFIYSFHYELKTQVIDSFGTGNRFCKWVMHKGDKLRNDVLFYPIIITPKSVTELECEFKAFFKIGHSHWRNSEFFLKPPKTIKVTA